MGKLSSGLKFETKVSVIVPCYNHGKFLEETITSVIRSTHPAIEIIIVDDGSKDNSIDIAKQFVSKYPNIRVLTQANKGPSAARNYGIRESSGSIILPLDADDLISPGYITEAVQVLESRKEVKVVYCNAEKFGAKKEPWKLKPFSLGSLAKDNMIFVSAMYRKSDWAACGGYSEDFVWGREDWEFWIKMLKDGGEVVRLPLTGFYYRVQGPSRRKSHKKGSKKKRIDYLNAKHPEFFKAQLNGPLRYQRSLSRLINFFSGGH